MKARYVGGNLEMQVKNVCRYRTRSRLAAFVLIGSIALSLNAAEGICGSESMQNIYPVDVTPQIDVKGEVITSRLVFVNRSDTSMLVKEGIHGFGVRGSVSRDPQTLVDDEFTISTNGRKLQYIGLIYMREPYTKEYFRSIEPGETIDVRYNRLDLAYEFLSGTHEYVLVHHHLEYVEKSGKIFRVNSRPVKFVYTRR